MVCAPTTHNDGGTQCIMTHAFHNHYTPYKHTPTLQNTSRPYKTHPDHTHTSTPYKHTQYGQSTPRRTNMTYIHPFLTPSFRSTIHHQPNIIISLCRPLHTSTVTTLPSHLRSPLQHIVQSPTSHHTTHHHSTLQTHTIPPTIPPHHITTQYLHNTSIQHLNHTLPYNTSITIHYLYTTLSYNKYLYYHTIPLAHITILSHHYHSTTHYHTLPLPYITNAPALSSDVEAVLQERWKHRNHDNALTNIHKR